MCTYASLSEDAVKKVADLESKLGVSILAYADFAALAPEDLQQVKNLENELNVSLLAYK